MNSESEEREVLQAKLDETGGKLVAAELSKLQGESEAEDLKKELEHQFREQLAQYKVREFQSRTGMFYLWSVFCRSKHSSMHWP